MIRLFLLTVSIFCVSVVAQAKTYRALIIGIDQYKPPANITADVSRSLWRNLSGCVNDASAMRDLVVAKFGFTSQNITTLFNTEAKRERIVGELRRLINSAEKGDVVFIYYAGHGSQMTNSLSVEEDKKDETIVPADAYSGVPDIRDKELAVFFNQLLDKGVTLTVIFDSCHSGSVGRGVFDISSVRYIEESPLDAKDPSDPPKPEERGALLLSAAQDFEFAKEIKDENNIPHGAFTVALLKALQQTPSNASVENIFSSLKAIMKFYGKTQEPVLAGDDQRLKGTLFGQPNGSGKTNFSIAVSKSDAKELELMGGYAFGLTVGTRLKSSVGTDTIKVVELIGANRSVAKLVSTKKAAISPGALFDVITWSSSGGPALRVYLHEKGISEQELTSALNFFKTARSNKKASFISDITQASPQRIYHFSAPQWWYQDEKEGKKTVGNSLQAVAGSLSASKSAFVNFPPSEKLVQQLRAIIRQYNNVEIVSCPEESLYTLIGTLNENNVLAYAFVRTQVTIEDSTAILPARTDYEVMGDQNDLGSVAEKLTENVFRIAKIKDWLTLQPPASENRFPFTLQIEYYRSGEKLDQQKSKLGDTLSLYLVKAQDSENWNRRKRYVYLFAIDQKGAMKLLFPNAARGNVENRLPNTNGMNIPEGKTKLADILVKPPLGYDSYFLLTSEEAIGNMSAFQQPGVVSRGPSSSETKNRLEALLFTGAKSRNKVTTPLTWSLDRITLKTTK